MRALPRLLIGSTLALLAAALPAPTASARQPMPRNVLALHWSSEDFPASGQVDAAIREVLLSRDDMAVDYFVEYLESDRFPEEDVSLALRDYIRVKYRDRRPEVVLAISEASLQFALRHRDELFPDAPIVYSGISEVEPAIRVAGPGVTGILSSSRSSETLALAMRLHPSTRRVFVVAQAPSFGLRDPVEALLRGVTQKVELTFVTEQSVPNLIAVIRSVPARSVILYVRASQETPANVLYPSEIARLIAEASPVPVYGISDSYVGSGIVGGAVSSSRSIGTRVGEITRRILAGARAQDIPIVRPAPVPTFDWRQLRRWNIDPSKLPPHSDIRFRVPTAWDQYRWYIVGAIVVTGLQGLMIASLVIESSRRRQSQRRYSLATAAGGVGVWDWNLETNELYMDPSVKAALGYEEEEIGNHLDDWFRLVHPDDANLDVRARAQEHIDGQRPYYEVEYRMLHRDGSIRWFLSRGSAMAHGGPRLTGTVIDITERKRAQHALDDMQAELARVSRLTALAEFAASISHELRQPLTAIVMNAKAGLRWLEHAIPDRAEVQAALWDIVGAGKRAEELIRRNRELFKQHRLRTEPLDINTVVRDVAALAAPRLRESQVALVTSLASGLPAVAGGRLELQQVLLNLIANGIDATENVEAGLRRIELSSERLADGFVKVSVSDNGVGFEGVDMQRIFSLSYTTKAHGTGIGLSLSRSIVEAHRGRLWAEPNHGCGATFSFTIPEHPAGAASEPVRPGPSKRSEPSDSALRA